MAQFQQFPFGVNNPTNQQPANGAFAILANPFAIAPKPPWAHGDRHGSVELGGRARSPTERARPRSRERRAGRTISPIGRAPKSPQAYRQRAEGVESETKIEDLDSRIGALEAMAVTHAELLQSVNKEVKGVANHVNEIVDKIKSLDTYAQGVDTRIGQVREGFNQSIEKQRAAQPRRISPPEPHRSTRSPCARGPRPLYSTGERDTASAA